MLARHKNKINYTQTENLKNKNQTMRQHGGK
jgi:hypothetical protein